jgi:hypothetical protein
MQLIGEPAARLQALNAAALDQEPGPLDRAMTRWLCAMTVSSSRCRPWLAARSPGLPQQPGADSPAAGRHRDPEPHLRRCPVAPERPAGQLHVPGQPSAQSPPSSPTVPPGPGRRPSVSGEVSRSPGSSSMNELS